jgi:serine/threonine-protein kinase
MSGSASEPDVLGQLAEEFLERCRLGERPAPTEYAARHPELAEQIRELFPALMLMEDVRPGPPTRGDVPPCTDSPRRLGEYRIVREIGRGGMGVVYEAEQESLGRRVALKVLAPGALCDARQAERFQREARAAARLHHTNIVPVFAVGEEAGTHYYVMQYIEGRPLDDVLAELRRLRDEAGPTTEKVPSAASSSSLLSDPHRPFAKSVAHLGVQVADALEYAAGQGVLHRDVKPSNLLLDVWGSVWLADFGLAKATGTPDLTRSGDLFGTLRYLAPERFEGRADVRSDVYALGLTLYEVLALRPAFDGNNQAELARQITTVEPPRLDRLNPHLPRDLVTIVHKAMARDPGDRYQTAAALAEDLRRFLDDRTILARRVSLPEQAVRWCRRNPAGAGLVAALLLLTVLATGGGAWLWQQRVERQNEAARRENEAARREELARQAVEAALEQGDPRRTRGRWPEARAVLTHAKGRLDEANSEDLRQRLRQTLSDLELAIRLEQIRADRATYAEDDFAGNTAVRDYNTAFTEAGLAVTELVTAERIRRSAIREELIAALDDWALTTTNGVMRWWLMRLASSVDPDPTWRDRLPGLLVWDERAALERLAAEVPVAQLSPQFLTLLEVRLRRAGADAEQLLRTAQQLHPADFWLNLDLAMALLRKGKTADAVGFLRAALAARPDCSYVHNKLGLTLNSLGNAEEAIAAYRRAVALDGKHANAHYNLAEALFNQGQTEKAVEEYHQAIAANPTAAKHSHNDLGELLEARGQVNEAMAEYRRAVARDPKATAPRHNLGRAHAARHEWAQAVECYAQVAQRRQTDTGHFWFEYATVLLLAGDRPGYLKACTHMVERCGDKMSDRRPYHVARACTLAPDSVPLVGWPARLVRDELDDQGGKFWSLTEQAALHYRAGRFKEAVLLLERSLQADSKSGRAVLNWLWLALANHRLGKTEEARRWLGEAQKWFKQYGDRMPSRAEEEMGLHLHNWLEAHVLLREAEAVVGATPVEAK